MRNINHYIYANILIGAVNIGAYYELGNGINAFCAGLGLSVVLLVLYIILMVRYMLDV